MTSTPDSRVECASQLPPPNVDEVRNPVLAAKPACCSFCVPASSTASMPGAKLEFITADRP
ncbi:hypothetical protein [Kutzneria kofuensis]|uniref:hypothetical protein n=1 Tax=Kutzneria kofuensis TaxID=103725 RepID=UPI003CD064A7